VPKVSSRLLSLSEIFLPLSEIFSVGRQLADVLEYLHGQQEPVIHRDIHSDNVLRSPDGRIRLIDFSLAGRLPPTSRSLRSEVASDVGSARRLLANLAPPGTPPEVVWRLRGCPRPGEPFTAAQLHTDLDALERDLYGGQAAR
jgi:serine/threonine protein kinase